jgi:hypothetical protein
MEMIKIDGKEISMIEFIEKKIRKIIRVCSANGSSIEGIVRENGFFYSEDDFQTSLVREFEKYYNDFIVYYEKSYGRNLIDIVLEKGSKQYPIELKYSYDKYGTDTDLSVGFVDDINKINNIVKDSENSGYCILLIKNKDDINKDMKDKLLKLKIEEKDLTLSGKAEWKKTIKDGVEETIEKEIEVTIKKLPIGKYGTIENYHYLIIEISKQSAEKIILK